MFLLFSLSLSFPQHVQVRNNCRVRIYPLEQSREQMFFSLQALKNAIPRVIVSGIPTVERAIINHQQHKYAELDLFPSLKCFAPY